MYNQWMILLVGMGTVFVALVAIIAMLELFHLAFGKRPEKKRPELAPLPEINSPIAPAPAKAQQTGGELVAVITAAIAAATGTSSTAFQIRSISASSNEGNGFNTPVWGQIERFARK